MRLTQRQTPPTLCSVMKSDTRLALTLSLLTAGVGLMLVGMTWLSFLGVALVVLSDSCASGRRPNSAALWVCLAAVVWILMRDGRSAFSRSTPEWWYIAGLVGVWCWGMIRAFLRRRAKAD
jgi:hypothetical protein